MADRPKMSVAEMLAAARKADGDGSQAEPAAEPAEEAPAAAEEATAEAPAAESASSSGEAPAKIPMPGSADRPNVADILAMARSGKSGGKKEKPKPKPAAKKAAPAAKAAAKPAPKPGEGAPKDTASILAAARGASKAGPMSKAEAAAKAKSAPTEKAKIVAPPMPEKPDYAKPKSEAAAKPAAKGKAKAKGGDKTEERRTFLWVGMGMLALFSGLWSLMLTRFLFPNVLREPPSKFKVGFPDAFAGGTVATKFKAQYGVWVVNSEYNGEPQLVALKTVCTHLGCTPSWLEAEQKYKCPCHGSGFYKDGINFEGPAPRPLERYAIRVADDGQVEIDKSRTFQEEMGQWADPACFIPV